MIFLRNDIESSNVDVHLCSTQYSNRYSIFFINLPICLLFKGNKKHVVRDEITTALPLHLTKLLPLKIKLIQLFWSKYRYTEMNCIVTLEWS